MLFLSTKQLIAYQELKITNEVKEHIKARISRGNSYGIVIGVVSASGTEFFSYGKKTVTGEEKVDEHTIFEIGSVTKVITTLLLADMIIKQEVKLSDPIEKYLPETVKIPERAGKKITFEHLATHTSGLPHIPTNFSFDSDNKYSETELYDFLSGYKLTRDIGSEFEYSGMGMGLIGHTLSLIANKNFEQLLIERICNSLGMNSTRIFLNSELKQRLSKAHSDKKETQYCYLPSVFDGAGSIRSTAVDLVNFLSANINIKNTVLKNAINLCHQPRKSTYGNEKIGLGWFISKRNGREIFYHAGNTFGFASFCGFMKKVKVGVVVLSNSHSSVSDIGFHLLTDGQFELDTIEK